MFIVSQSDAILEHLKSGKSINPIEALNLYGCFRLGARILDLRREGYEIETETVHTNGKHFAKYRMKLATPDAYKVQGELLKVG